MFERRLPALWRRREQEDSPSIYNIFDEFFGESRLAPLFGGSMWSGNISLDLVERDDEYLVKAELPGLDPKEVDITLEGGVLTIRAEHKEEHEEKKDKYLHKERRFGSYTRSLRLPGTIKEDDIKASFDKGILEIHLPKAEESKAHKISIS